MSLHPALLLKGADMVSCPKCHRRQTRPDYTPFICAACRKLVHIPGVATR